MIGLKRTSKLEIMATQTNNKYKSPYGDHEWQEDYSIWEHGFERGAQWMLEKAIERYSSEIDKINNLFGLIDKNATGLINKEKSIEKFRKALEESL